jgi:hypothetical protein
VVDIIKRDSFSREDAKDKAPSHFDLVKEMANRFIILTSYGGNPSPID